MSADARRRARLFAMAIALAAGSAARAGDETPSPIRAELVATGLERPVAAAFPPGDDAHALAVGKLGRVQVVDLETGAISPTLFLDLSSEVISANSRGLLDLEFDPNYDANGFFYVAYNAAPDSAMTIARYTISADPLVADPASGVVMKTIPHTQSNPHNGGELEFSPVDDHLYFFSGDGSTHVAADEDNNAQNPALLLGKALRLDVDQAPDYIPVDNPFVDDPQVRDEIWAFGLRNPWRCSFDRVTGDLYIADVGWSSEEEIDFQPFESPGGENYGWRCQEGALCTDFVDACVCLDDTLTQPIYSIPHGEPTDYCSVIGGFVYRGVRLPELWGRYLFADYCVTSIRSILVAADGAGGYAVTDEMDHTSAFDPAGAIREIVAFGEDDDGELYLVSWQEDDDANALWRIGPACLADVSRDGQVSVDDLLIVLAQWGPCEAACLPDISGDGNAGVDDLLLILAAWGPCE